MINVFGSCFIERPLLFLLYIYDLAIVSKACFPILFADGSNMFISGKDVQAMSVKLNSDCWLDWICLTMRHVLQDILAVLHK